MLSRRLLALFVDLRGERNTWNDGEVVEMNESEWPNLTEVLESAARLQSLVPDAVLVGGTAAAWHAGHRVSFDHDHVVGNLRERFDAVLGALEADPEFVFNRARAGTIILGELGGIETGVRQLIRKRPLEVEEAVLPSGARLRVPTGPEALRVKAYLAVKRNQVRDYLDIAALSDTLGVEAAAREIAGIDHWYSEPSRPGERPVRDQVIRQLANPQPRDTTTIRHLASYKGLIPRWRDWAVVCAQLADVAEAAVRVSGDEA
jgi:hypothetical protein